MHNLEYADFAYANVNYVLAPLEKGTYAPSVVRTMRNELANLLFFCALVFQIKRCIFLLEREGLRNISTIADECLLQPRVLAAVGNGTS